MRRRWTWVAWSLLVIFAASLGVAILLSLPDSNFQRQPGFHLALLLAMAAFMAVGAVIVAHRPGNAIGWLFSAIGLVSATDALALEYTEYATSHDLVRCPARSWRPGSNGGGCRCSAWSLCSPCCCFPPAGCCRPAGDPSQY